MKLKQAVKLATVAGVATVVSAGASAISTYSQTFEGLNQADGAALSNDGWLVFNNVFDGDPNGGGNFKFGYGPFGAPNGGAAFSAIDAGQGGVPQGAQQLVTYSDYNCCDLGTATPQGHGNGTDYNESLVFQEQFNNITAADVGSVWTWSYDTKQGNIATGPNSSAYAFIKTLDPNAGYSQSSFESTATGTNVNWATDSVSLTITAGLVGHILQYGFGTIATNFEDSGVFYDNVSFSTASAAVPVPAAAWLFGSALAGLVAARRKQK